MGFPSGDAARTEPPVEVQGMMLPGPGIGLASPVVGRAVAASGMFPPPKPAAAPVVDDSPNGPTPAVGAVLQSAPLGEVAPPRSLGDIDNVPLPLKIAPVPSATTLGALGQPPPRSVGDGLSPPPNKSVAPSGTPAPSRAAAAALAPGGGGADVSLIAVRPELSIALPIEGAGACAKPVLLESRIAAAMMNRPITTCSCLRIVSRLRKTHLPHTAQQIRRRAARSFAELRRFHRDCANAIPARL
jgi:hypothetical protein